jgi:signal transduction histidine kinase
MTGDHLVFISVAAVLIISVINTIVLNHQHGWRQGEAFWFWGLVALSISYTGFGISIWIGKPALIIANIGLLLAYLAMSLQLRYWQTGKSNISVWLIVGVVVYIVLLETLRAYHTYTYRLLLIQSVLTVITAYLLWSAIKYFLKIRSNQLILLACTFAVELLCVLTRMIYTVMQPEFTNGQMTLYEEPLELIVIRWVWLMANAMSYITVMTYELEKTLNKNETLNVLLKEKKLLLNALSQLNRSNQSAAVGSILSHELRQPLTTLLLASTSLQAQIKSNDLTHVAEQVDFLCHEIKRSTTLVNQLDDVFLNKKPSHLSVQLATPISESIRVLKPRLTAESISLELRGNLSLIVAGESEQLQTVFINLISNSINALSHQNLTRLITIDVSANQHTCMIQISDNGIGIDSSVLPNLWQPYITDSNKGHGIGLWLTQQILHSLGGKVEAGNNPDAGAWFRVKLPLNSP